MQRRAGGERSGSYREREIPGHDDRSAGGSPSQEGLPIPNKGAQWQWWLGPAFLLLLTLGMFGDLLFNPDRVLSQLGTDLSGQFIALREFGFRQLGSGNLALWNPHLFAGIPLLGGFQSALLYPPNLLHLVLPVAAAVNLLIALHLFLSGLFAYCWALRRGLHPLAAVLCGALLMFCGAQFLHIYAGHLTNLQCMAWVPLLLLAVDGLFETREIRWCLLGMAAMAMQVLAGHPQYVFYTAVTAFIYFCFRIVNAQSRLAVTIGMAAIFAGAAALTAVQLLTGMEASSQSIRGQGVPYEFAAMFSFPPENLITLLAPNFFGDMVHNPYWGRCYLWEMSLFMGATGLRLAIYGSLGGDRRLRLFSLPMVLILFLLALGAHTPLFRVLYHTLPGFNQFRGNSKFIFQASLFLALLAGIGLDRLLNFRPRSPRLALSVSIFALIVFAAGLVLLLDAGGRTASWWGKLMNAVAATRESYLPPQAYSAVEFVTQAAAGATWSLLVAAGTLAVLAVLVWALKYGRGAACAIMALAIVEVLVFARASRVTFDPEMAMAPHIQQFYREHPGDYRVLDFGNPNLAMLTGKGDLWGYDPGVSRRYAQFMAFSQGEDPDRATQYLNFRGPSRLYRMLRLKYVFIPEGEKIRVQEIPGGMDRLHLVYDYEALEGRDRIFAAMSGDFDPTRKVILESPPEPAPRPPAPGVASTVRLLDSSTDHLTIRGDLGSPAVLLVTDGYGEGWRARPLDGSSQPEYRVMPANYVLMAVPLAAGHHHFRLEYVPRAFTIGKWISLVSGAAFLGVAGSLLIFGRGARPNGKAESPQRGFK